MEEVYSLNGEDFSDKLMSFQDKITGSASEQEVIKCHVMKLSDVTSHKSGVKSEIALKAYLEIMGK